MKLLNNKYHALLRWWLFFAIASLGTVALYMAGIIKEVNQADFTKLSFLIFAVFSIFTIRTGIDTYRLCKEDTITPGRLSAYYNKSEIGWFVSDMLLTLGMIGTVAGFIYMLGTSFVELDPHNAFSMQGVLTKMSTGMSTALYTTAAGLVCSLLLKIQLFNFTHQVDYLSERTSNEDAEKKIL